MKKTTIILLPLIVIVAIVWIIVYLQKRDFNECLQNYNYRECELITLIGKLEDGKDEQILKAWWVYYQNRLNNMKEEAIFGNYRAYIKHQDKVDKVMLAKNNDVEICLNSPYSSQEVYRNLYFFDSGRKIYFESKQNYGGAEWRANSFEVESAIRDVKESGYSSPSGNLNSNNYDLTPDGKFVFSVFGDDDNFKVRGNPASVWNSVCKMGNSYEGCDYWKPLYSVETVKCSQFGNGCAPFSFGYYDAAKKAVILAGRYETNPSKQNFKAWEFSTETGNFIQIY